MCTRHYPLYEDINVMAGNCDAPPDYIIANSDFFWKLRARILHERFPSDELLQLVLFSASGYSYQKQCFKASWHIM